MLRIILTLSVLLTSLSSYGNDECIDFHKYVENRPELDTEDYINYCSFINDVYQFRNDFIKRFSESKWKSLQYVEEPRGFNITLLIYDINIEEALRFANFINGNINKLPKTIKVLNVNEDIYLIRTNDKYIFDVSLKRIPVEFKNGYDDFVNAMNRIRNMLEGNSTADEIMDELHSKITLPYYEML